MRAQGSTIPALSFCHECECLILEMWQSHYSKKGHHDLNFAIVYNSTMAKIAKTQGTASGLIMICANITTDIYSQPTFEGRQTSVFTFSQHRQVN